MALLHLFCIILYIVEKNIVFYFQILLSVKVPLATKKYLKD